MTVDEAIEILWDAMRRGVYFPEPLQQQLTLDQGYRVQCGVVARWLAMGEQQAGWKIALSSTATREMFGLDTPVFAHLFASRHFSSGQTLQHGDIINPAIEPELCLTMGRRLQGPGVTRDQVLEAVEQVAPAFEVVSFRGDVAADFPLAVADNVGQWGFVTGSEVRPYPKGLELGEVTVEVRKNGALEARERGAEVIDDQLDSIAWLANALAPYDVAIEAGQRVMTGSFTKPMPVAKGDRWETSFSSIGTITASFM